jgi:predicted methyltransferase
MNKTLAALSCLALVACQLAAANESPPAAAPQAHSEAATPAAEVDALAAILDAQPDETKLRYRYRHPRETIEFIGIEPGMTVIEGLPGRGWYTKILLPLLGSEGRVIGANYSLEMYPLFSFASEEFMESQRRWTTDFPAGAAEWAGEGGAEVAAFHFGALPDEYVGTADVVFLVRALHNLARFSEQGDFLGAALADSFAALKPGGVLGIVQHHARDDKSDEFASGSRGYLKKSFVIGAAERAGFEFVAESDINVNPNDQPSDDDIVWRLPPTLGTSADNPQLRAELESIGESNRMTLKFRKPD